MKNRPEAVAYMRVGSREQLDEERIAIYCRSGNPGSEALTLQIAHVSGAVREKYPHAKLKVYADEASSFHHRHRFDKLMQDAENHAFDRVVVLKPDRISREFEAVRKFERRMKELEIEVEYLMGEPWTNLTDWLAKGAER